MINEVFKSLADQDIFSMNYHIKDTFYNLNNHYFTLLKLIAQNYVNIRCFNTAKNESNRAKVRQKLPKLIHFQNQ